MRGKKPNRTSAAAPNPIKTDHQSKDSFFT
jgi:hypothetical protein